jgi:hypothetical protein
MVIKIVKTKHYIYAEYERLKEAYPYNYKLPCFIGKYHYYFVKNDKICSLVDMQDHETNKFLQRGRYELCHPRNYFNTVEEAINFIEGYFDDNDIEWIDRTNESLTQPQLREILGLPKER